MGHQDMMHFCISACSNMSFVTVHWKEFKVSMGLLQIQWGSVGSSQCDSLQRVFFSVAPLRSPIGIVQAVVERLSLSCRMLFEEQKSNLRFFHFFWEIPAIVFEAKRCKKRKHL